MRYRLGIRIVTFLQERSKHHEVLIFMNLDSVASIVVVVIIIAVSIEVYYCLKMPPAKN